MFDNTTSTFFSSTINNQSNVTGLADGLIADHTQLNKTFTGSSTKISSNSLQASAQAIATNAFTIQPDLIVNAFSVPTIASSNSYLNFNYTAKNQGTATANTNWTYFYLSTDQNLNANIDTLIPTFRTSLSSIVVVCKFIAKGTQFGNKNQCFSDNTFCSTD